jgi:hypothetical protein
MPSREQNERETMKRDELEDHLQQAIQNEYDGDGGSPTSMDLAIACVIRLMRLNIVRFSDAPAVEELRTLARNTCHAESQS